MPFGVFGVVLEARGVGYRGDSASPELCGVGGIARNGDGAGIAGVAVVPLDKRVVWIGCGREDDRRAIVVGAAARDGAHRGVVRRGRDLVRGVVGGTDGHTVVTISSSWASTTIAHIPMLAIVWNVCTKRVGPRKEVIAVCFCSCIHVAAIGNED